MKLQPEVQVQNANRWGDQETTVVLRTSVGNAALYFKMLQKPRTPTRDMLNDAVQVKVQQRLGEGNEATTSVPKAAPGARWPAAWP